MRGHDLGLDTARNYLDFAEEARGRSAGYQALAEAVAADAGILGFLATLPAPKRQPNLLFAAARYLLGMAPEPEELRALISARSAELTAVMMARRTQTNEPARCATGHLSLRGARLRHAGGPAAIRRDRPRPAGRLAIQRGTWRRPGPAGTPA